MGLDQYIYRTTKKRWNAHLEFEKLCKKYFGLVKKLEDEMEWEKFLGSLPKKENPRYDSDYDFEKFTRKQNGVISRYKRECRKIAKSLDLKLDGGPKFQDKKYGLNSKDDSVEEVMYWRKEWGLHKYIVDNFWKDKENDNLVYIPLRRKDIKKMISDGVFPETFEELLGGLDKDHVLYYHPWY
jgi:hypothetical protein